MVLPLLPDLVMARQHARVTFYGAEGPVCLEQPQMLEQLAAVRQQLRGCAPGSLVAIAAPTSARVFIAILAAWAEGLAVSLLPHELGSGSGRLDARRFNAMLEVLDAGLVLVEAELLEHVAAEWRERTRLIDSLALNPLPEPWQPCRAQAQGLALVQFTSGSTGQPKGVCLTHQMISQNCAAIAERVAISAADCVVSWLPLHHDMGLSALTMAWWRGPELVLMPSRMFARNPMSWLQVLSRHRGSLSPAPTSAYALLSRFASRVGHGQLDLSNWRYAWVGAEPVFHTHVRAFEEAYAAHGLARHVVQPAYGMAEAVVAVTLNPPGQPLPVCWVDPERLNRGEVHPLPADDAQAVPLLGNGWPLAGVQLQVCDEQGHGLPDGRLGQIRLRGEAVMHRYLGREPERPTPEHWYATGDIGFVHEGQLYITGRSKDLITRAGVNVSPQAVEWAVEQALELPPGSVAAFSCLDARQACERVVVAIAGKPVEPDAQPALLAQVSRAAVSAAGVQVDNLVLIRRADIPRTTSGKIQRALLREAYLQQQLDPLAALADPA